MPREGSPSETGLYLALEKHLKQTKTPMTCVDLFDKSDVRSKAQDANQVSDALGHLWRRNFIKRMPAPKSPHQQARWAYYWPESNVDATIAPPKRSPATFDGEVVSRGRQVVLAKPTMTITEDGGVIEIDMPHFTIRITAK